MAGVVTVFAFVGALYSASIGAAERVLDTGAIRVTLGQTSGFIDAVDLDLDGDGKYSADEAIVRQPANEPAVVVTYIVGDATSGGRGVTTGKAIRGTVKVDTIDGADLQAVIKGNLRFEGYGTTPFEIDLQGKKGSAVLNVGFSFAPLKAAPNLLLKEASLRLYGVFEQGEPGKVRLRMSTGAFRNTPRPDSAYQPLVWQFGGNLVESAWHWRSWLSWSESTGPVTVRDGAVPPKELAFYMHDDRQGIQAAMVEPAGAAPVELAGVGLPTNLGLYAWSPRVPPLPMRKDLPDRLQLSDVGLHFFAVGAKGIAADQYNKKVNAALAASRQELIRELKPVQSTFRDPRLAPETVAKRQNQLASMSARGWDANVAETPLPPPLPAPLPPAAEKVALSKNSVTLDIDNPPTTDGVALPARGGIPFGRAVLKSTDNLRLVDADGNEIPIQVDKLAMWPDGSVKWALITFLGDAKGRAPYRLEYGEGVTRKALPKEKLSITRTSDGFAVDTGPLRFRLSKGAAGLFDDLRFKAPGTSEEALSQRSTESERANRMDLLALGSPGGYAPYAYHAEGAQTEPSRAVIEDIAIEREGPLSAHLVVKGRYRYAKLGRGRGDTYKNEGCEFWLRYTVYAGQSYVEVKHSFVFEGNPDIEMIRELALSLPIKMDGTPQVTVGADGKSLPAFATRKAGVFQDNAHAAEIWSGTGVEENDRAGDERIVDMAKAADGWMDVNDGKRGVTFGVRHMREMYAKELAFDDGRLNIGLWPKRARLLDTRRYARQYGEGESTSFGQGAAQGVSRTHDLFFYFHTGDAASAQGAKIARNLLQPAFIKAPSSWYADTEAAGAFHARDSSRQHAAWEGLIADGIDYFFYHRQLWSWFGIYDYGDFQQVPNRNGGWERLAGRWGWGNNEALIDMLFYEQFMRTGKREYLDTALAMTGHTQEVDLINSHDYKGNHAVKMHGHRHNVDHWGDGYVGIRVAAPHGFRLGYFLTGDLRILDQMRMGMDAHWESMNAYDKEHSAGLGYLTFFWETTGDKRYEEALKGYLDFQVGHFKKFGNIHGDVWNFRKDIHRPLPEKPLGGPPTIFFFQNFGAAYSLMELAELTGRQDLVDAVVQFARTTMLQRGSSWEALFCHYRLMAFAYKHTGDPAFLNYATEHAVKLGAIPNRKTWAQANILERFDNKLSMLAWTAQGLPYVMQAMDLRAKDPAIVFDLPWTVPVPADKREADVPVSGNRVRARAGTIDSYEWQVDGKSVSSKKDDTLKLSPGKHLISLRATDNEAHSASASQAITVWEPGVVAQLCFRGRVDGFVGGEYNDAKGYGYTRGTRVVDTAEPQRFGGKGCPEVHIKGGVRVKTGPGRFTVEMGGTDFWTETMGTVNVQDKALQLPIVKEASKKLSWSYTGEVTVGADGVLSIDFVPGAKGEPVVLAYVIVREKRK